MLKRTGLVALALALMTTAAASTAVVALSAQDAAAPHFATAVADSRRPAEDVARDGLRKPAEMLAFGEVQPGQRIADIRPEEGYFTRLFAPAVGETGRVYAFVPTRTATRETPLAEALAAAFPNVTPLTGALDAMTFPEPLDAVFMVQEYHDFHIPAFNTDVARMNRAVFEALKPGGVYIVIDHSGRAGTGATEVQSLHRIEGEFLKAEVEAAGFVFEAESLALANPEDDRTINVFDPAIRGRTDQFVYRFRKPL
jgi:predicted methyltransferase